MNLHLSFGDICLFHSVKSNGLWRDAPKRVEIWLCQLYFGVGETGAMYHKSRSDAIKHYKRCAAETVLLRTFCPFPAQGFGRWCAGMVWVRAGDCEIRAKAPNGITPKCRIKSRQNAERVVFCSEKPIYERMGS